MNKGKLQILLYTDEKESLCIYMYICLFDNEITIFILYMYLYISNIRNNSYIT